MKTFLPLFCAAALLLAVSLPLSAAPDGDRGAVQRHELETQLQLLENNLSRQVEGTLRDEMGTQFQHLERKLSGQVEDAALATARQERRLTELENELHKLQEERKTWLDDAQNPIIATAEKKKEEVRATGDRYVSIVGALLTGLGVLAAITAILPILLTNRFIKETKRRLKEIDTQVTKIKETGEKNLAEYKNMAEFYLKKLKKYEKKGKKKINNIEHNNISDSKTLRQLLIQATPAQDNDNSTGDFIVKNSYSEKVPAKLKKTNLNTLWELVTSAQEQHNWEKACYYIGDILEETPQDEAARFALARCQVQMGKNPAISKEQRKILWEQAENYYQSRLPQTTGADITSFVNIRISYAILKEEKTKYAHSKEESSKLLAEAYDLLQQVYTVTPDNVDILLMLAACRYKQTTYANKSKKEQLLQERKALLEKALKLSPQNIQVLQVLSVIYSRESQTTTSREDKKLLLRKALNLLNEAKNIDPQDIKTLKLLAIITDEIIPYSDDEKETLKNNYIDILNKAHQLAPQDTEILGLLFLHEISSTEIDKETFYPKLQDIFDKILNLHSQNIPFINTLIPALDGIAQKSSRVKRDFIFRKIEVLLSAIEKVAPFDSITLKNFAAFRIEQTREAEAQAREDLLQQAEGYLDRILPSEQKITLFNRACIAALRSQPDKALELLEECRQAGTLPSRKHLESDKDLDSLRDQDAFKEFMARAYPAEDDTEDSE